MLQDIGNLLCNQQWGVKSIGFWGMPGIGKTELAKAVFDQMSSDYEVTCFLHNFHETFETKGLYSLLQEHFKNLTNQNVPKRVLLVLDDVRNHLYAESLLAELPSLSPGSLIIITSRDEQVLSQYQVNQTYKVEGLNKNEAMQLFSRCAFEKDVKQTNLLKGISMKVIEYADGNPLALRVYGKEMSSQEQLSQKETLFLKLKQDPPHQIMEVVKSSYHALSDNEKNILVYIAFCFTGKHVEDVSKLLQDLGFFPEIGIDRLVAKSLVTISENKLEMHNMIQAVIKKIGRCSEDPNTSFKCVLGTTDIEAISLDASNLNPDVQLSLFRSMYNLRYLNIYYSNPGKHGKALESLSLPYGLGFLHWETYPLKSLPQDFDPSNLVELNMPYSQLQTLWGGTKNLKMLKRINLRHSQKLLEVDELSEALNIEEVDLCGCRNLRRFPSIGNLHKLRIVDLPSFTGIEIFPEFPSNVELKLEGSLIETMSMSPPASPIGVKSLCEFLDNPTKPLNFERHGPHILDILRPGSFYNNQKRITNPDMVETQPEFKDIMCETAISMSQWVFKKLNSFRKVD
ncbi:disease resistance protein RRS1-like [Raphanus sativus]|uniref:Disease resistance protein RRS1-like n=1 Tax=Raphanus sativus TaxID=3726 RepID=A0A9W3CCX2_RAPSA|nr:disease resistance protein RRS1-like [Raphanus sativus]